MKLWQDEGLNLGLPAIHRVEYLRDMMANDQLGWCDFDSMGGTQPHSWSELKGYSEALGLDLEPWEFSAIRSMSLSYVEGYIRGSSPMVVSPAYVGKPKDDPGLAVERQRVSNQLKAALRRKS